jgi:hypothetical protein
MGGSFPWEYEQTGYTLNLYQGPGGKPKVKLKDCKVSKISVTCHEGGTTDWEFFVYSADVDEDSGGLLVLLKAQERDIELIAPDLLSSTSAQKDLTEDEDDNPLAAMQRGATVTTLDSKKK